jgi:cyclopropane fatty-acyl-phospholipid synthase-like methyltransferase
MQDKPFSEACERNKRPILDVIAPLLATAKSLLEIGSGTGQHAVFFGETLPHLTWQTSDCKENHDAINHWLDDAHLDNVIRPVALNVLQDPWPSASYNAVFSANTAHIMPWQAVEAMFAGVSRLLPDDGVFLLYGPFNYDGKFTSESNAQFNIWLKSQAPHQGIRDFEAVDQLARNGEMKLHQDFAMPANNRILVWQKNSID